MAQIIDVPNYGPVEFPDGMSDADIVAAIKKSSLGYKKESSALSDIAFGALKGASDIGSTILSPLDALGITGMSNAERRQKIQDFMGERADTDSAFFKGGELVADIAGTAGAGGVIAKGLRAIPAVANAAPKVISAIESGGFNLGSPAATTLKGKLLDAATRAGGGAVLGGVSSGMIDPETAATGATIGAVLPGGVKAAGMVGSGLKNAAGSIAKNTLGVSTGAGGEAVSAALNAGKTGNQSFLNNMRGKVDMTDVLDDAKNALSNMREARAAEYRNNIASVKADKSVLDFSGIDGALNNGINRVTFKGQVKDAKAASYLDDVSSVIDEWKQLDPADFHTPEGMDALKQKVGAILEGIPYEQRNARAVVGDIYNSIKKEISSQAHEYSKVMKDYSQASELITEIEKALSLGQKASADTSMRKLQSLMRNNVNTNYGNRLSLAKELESKGGKDILPAIAGQAMNSATPRGLQGLAATGAGIYGLTNPLALAALPFQSPRLIGEAAYGIGRASGMAGNAANGLLNTPAMQGLTASARRQLANPMNLGLLSVAPTLALSR